ncbi:MAG: DUF1232 domain-containing protein [Deltaproteobacteria bacterium]|nr:DUF1232 domain-containing protein [Deltaproteobacteria bacterium]
MSSTAFRVSFTLDEQDVAYFRSLFRKAKRTAREGDPKEILAGARTLVEKVRSAGKAPKFVVAAIEALEDLVQIIEDADWKAPKSVVTPVLAALAYFSEPEDLIPDHIPVLGFLDDAIMMKFVEREFKHELAAYRRFRRFRDGAEQRPWTPVARGRLPSRLDAQRKKLRAEVDRRKKTDEKKGILGF